jgi:tRNA pseudouridine55 synthase
VGIFVIDKPLHLTSFDVVAKARKLLNTRRIGHTGTLDPLATGVLILCTEDSTKLVQFLETDSKDYLAFVSLGAGTPTLDAEGPILETAPVPAFSTADLERALSGLRGAQSQLPPAYSAIHVGGERAYDLARQGKEVKLAPRRVTVHRLQWLSTLPTMRDASPASSRQGFPPPLGDFPTLVLMCSVSSGTYIRSLARDLGAALGTVAHLAGLVRTRVGPFKLEDALSLEELRPERALPDLNALDLPRLEVSARQAKDIRDGKRLPHDHGGRAVVTLEGKLVAIVDGDGSSLKVLRGWQE